MFQKYSYAGVQFKAYCFCGNSYGLYGAAAESECNMVCSGDNTQRCGGSSRNGVYKITRKKNDIEEKGINLIEVI